MQRIISIIILVLFSITAFTNAYTSKADFQEKKYPESAAEIVNAFIEACGGSALSDIKTEIRKGTLFRSTQGKVPFEIICEYKDKWCYNQVFAWGDQLIYGYDGETGWIRDTKSVEQMSMGQILDFQMLMNIQSPSNMKELFSKMRIVGKNKIEAAETIIILASVNENLSRELEFDCESGLLLRAGDIYIEDYRSVGEIKRPFRIRLGEKSDDHYQMVMQIDEIQQNVEIDSDVFKQPVSFLPFKNPPLYKSRKHIEVDISILDEYVGVYQQSGKPDVDYIISRQDKHLMLERTGWGQKFEIKPESETDFYIKFLAFDFRFVKDESGKVTHFVFNSNNGSFEAKKIK
ncbi:hypothetical protein ACFL6O_02135 [candidate division KSB1 bacterium]